jgi:hypothetical protein
LSVARVQVCGKPCVQPLAVSGPVFAVLLELHDVGADQPISDDERLIHGSGRAAH